MMDPKRLRTSDVMRDAAIWLTTLLPCQPRSDRRQLEALIQELRIRARWMASGSPGLRISSRVF